MLFVAVSCQAQQTHSNNGVAVAKTIFYDQRNHTYNSIEHFMPSIKVWYKDSVMIQRILKSMSEEFDDGRPTKRWVELIGYTFIDLKNRSFYHYKTFSDTARIVGKWMQPDSVSINYYGGGWNLHYRSNWFKKKSVSISDTVIEEINYRRLLFKANEPDSTPCIIAYFRCDKKGIIIKYEKELSENVGCPLVRFEQIPDKIYPHAGGSEIVYEREHLTDEELKVFSAWEKNAKENPIQK